MLTPSEIVNPDARPPYISLFIMDIWWTPFSKLNRTFASLFAIAGPYVSHNWRWISSTLYPLACNQKFSHWSYFYFHTSYKLRKGKKTRNWQHYDSYMSSGPVEATVYVWTNQCCQSLYNQSLILKCTLYILCFILFY